jgi:enolase
MPIIAAISFRRVLNSHVEFTTEFLVRLGDGSVGRAASPQGETISIYEDRKSDIDPEAIVRAIENDGLLGPEISQASFDTYLQRHIPAFGRNNAFALSEAFFVATCRTRTIFDLFGKSKTKLEPPRIALNILNGGWHAYTNPVLSDFSEFMLVPKIRDIAEVISVHSAIQRVVKEKQAGQPKVVVSGHPVNGFATRDNREVMDFLLAIVESLGLSGTCDLMIDASAGDLWTGEAYRLGITDGTVRSSAEFADYWASMIRDYHLRFLEDPFHEKDFASWRALTTTQPGCFVIGDNLYSSDETRIREGAADRYASGAVIKPNQAGTVTAVTRALEAALATGQIAITSHRSISTESTFLSMLTCMLGAQVIKIGPLATDYSSVVRLNEIIRLTEDADAG